MNRFSTKIAALSVAVLLAASVAQAREKAPKHKKNQDLSANPLKGVVSSQPDKVLYDKAMTALKKGKYDVARLDLQTLLNTYPDSEYRMRAKLAVGDTWFKEGGTASLTQAEAEYKDFITFFPQAPEAAEAQMKVADIYFEQMEKPDRDSTNAERAEAEYRNMINQFPDSQLAPRAKQRLREVQEVMAEREASIGFYYQSRENFSAAIARLRTVADTYPLYSKSDQVLLSIGDSYLALARATRNSPTLAPAVRERVEAVYRERAIDAFAKVITRYPMAPHVEDARDRLVGMNRSIPEPSQKSVAENEAEEQSRQGLRFTDSLLGFIKHGPAVVEAAHVGDPSLEDPKRTFAPDVTKENVAIFTSAAKPVGEGGKTLTPTSVNEPPRSDQPSAAPVQGLAAGEGGTGLGLKVKVVEAPGKPVSDPVLKAVGPANTALPEAEKPEAPPEQVNDVKPGSAPTVAADAQKNKSPKADLGEESSSKKKKKKGLDKLNPF
jgi:outer membrane protein assembly factor BamD